MAVSTIQTGNNFDHTPSSAMVAGEPVELHAGTNFIGVAIGAIPANELGTLAVEGVFSMTKDNPTDVHALGAPVAVDVSGGVENVTASATGKHVIAKASANGDSHAWVKINVR